MKGGLSLSEKTIYKDLDKLEYNTDTLSFLRKKLDYFTIEIFLRICKANKKHKGILKTKLKDYHVQRKKYDTAFTILEAQGFIERREEGTSTPYFTTIRGTQLLQLLLHIEKDENVMEILNKINMETESEGISI